MSAREITCTACGQTALARIEPLYADFKKIGEEVVCTACGHRYAGVDAAPFTAVDRGPRVFTEADKPRTLQVFADDERRKCCTWCAHFTVNPFNQRCGLTNRVVEATDLCIRFTAKPAVEDGEKEDAP